MRYKTIQFLGVARIKNNTTTQQHARTYKEMISHGLSSDELQNIEERLIEERSRAYCPYSKFHVGCVLFIRGSTEPYICGCNVENASFGGTICAERVAMLKAISNDCKEGWTALAIIGDTIGSPDKVITPCGMCRQVMSEFIKDMETFPILMYSSDLKKLQVTNMNELMPMPFDL